MAASKKWSYGKGKYYFNVNSGFQNITISRATRDDAAYVFLDYKRKGKTCEWLGQWNGKKFEDDTAPQPEKN